MKSEVRIGEGVHMSSHVCTQPPYPRPPLDACPRGRFNRQLDSLPLLPIRAVSDQLLAAHSAGLKLDPCPTQVGVCRSSTHRLLALVTAAQRDPLSATVVVQAIGLA